MKSLFAELKRRQIYKFGVIYLAVAWLLALGFPVVLLVAWFLDRTRDNRAAGDELAPGEIRFCTTPEGHRLAYSRFGSGPPLLRTGNWISHLEAERGSPMHRPMLRDLSREFSVDTMVADMKAVADANALDRFSILAYSQSCAVALAFAALYPERVSRMVLFGGFMHNFRTPEEIDALATLFRQSWGQDNPATRQIFTTVLAPDSTREEFEGFNELQRQAIAPETASRSSAAARRPR